MTRQFHARVRPRRQSSPKVRVLGPHALSFRCYRLVPGDAPDGFEIVELVETRNAMGAFVCER